MKARAFYNLVLLIGLPASFDNLQPQAAPPPPGQETTVATDEEVMIPLTTVSAVIVTGVGGVPGAIINGAINIPKASVRTGLAIKLTTPDELLNVTFTPAIGTPLQVTVPVITPPQMTVPGRGSKVMLGDVQGMMGGQGQIGKR